MTRRRAIGVALLLAAHTAVAAAEEPAWKRGEIVALRTDECQELRVDRAGAGLLELRFFDGAMPLPVGPDPKTSGASLLLPASDPESASFVLYDASGMYSQSARLTPPIRWTRSGRDLCVGSGATPVFCGRTHREIEWTTRIAFGAGWETRIGGCAPLPPPDRPLPSRLLGGIAVCLLLAGLTLLRARNRWERVSVALLVPVLGFAAIAAHDPWLLPFVAIVAAAALACVVAGIGALRGRSRPWSVRGAPITLAALAATVLSLVPHPVWTDAATPPAAPALWLDPASWQPRAAHQSLEFRDRPVASLAPDAPNWLVLGGSVVFGDGVEAHQAFPAVAQDLLRARGDRTMLFNAGVQGWNIGNIDRFMADAGGDLPLTGVVLVSILNNATIPIVAPSAPRCDTSLFRAWLCNATRSQAFFLWPKVFLPKPRSPERYRDMLSALLAREQARGRKIVLLDEIGEIDTGLRIWNTETYREIARAVAAERGVPFYPVSDAVASLPPAERYLDGIHPTPAMHALLGKRLAEILREP